MFGRTNIHPVKNGLKAEWTKAHDDKTPSGPQAMGRESSVGKASDRKAKSNKTKSPVRLGISLPGSTCGADSKTNGAVYTVVNDSILRLTKHRRASSSPV